jgi:hypothetical protein
VAASQVTGLANEGTLSLQPLSWPISGVGVESLRSQGVPA